MCEKKLKLSRSERLRLQAFKNVMERKKKELYSLKDVEYLKKYYSDKVIGIMYDMNTKTRIESISIKDYGKGFYDLECYGKTLKQPQIRLIISIKSVAERLDLDLPKEVLKNPY